MTSQAISRRLTVQEAAEVLGTSVDAVRMRARRGSLESEKDSDGRVYVWVDPDESETRHRLNGESTALISAKDETIRVLQEQLEAEREAHKEARRIIAGLVQRIPELELHTTSRSRRSRQEPLRASSRSRRGESPGPLALPPPTPAESVRRPILTRGGGAGWRDDPVLHSYCA
jgi:hypothetical protein